MKERFTPHLKKGDLAILISIAFFLILLLFLIYNKKEGAYVFVHEGDTKTKYALDKSQQIPIFIEGNMTNLIVIEDGKVFMKQATCPDQICVKHKPIQKDKEMIICLPNQVFVEVVSEDKTDVDN